MNFKGVDFVNFSYTKNQLSPNEWVLENKNFRGSFHRTCPCHK